MKIILAFVIFVLPFQLWCQNYKIYNDAYNDLKAFDSLYQENPDEAIRVLNKIEKAPIAKTNDTLQSMLFFLWGKYYIGTNQYNNAIKSLENGVKFGEKHKLFKIAFECAHAISYSYLDTRKLDSALLSENKAMEFAKRDNNENNINRSLTTIVTIYTEQGRFLESNKLCFDYLDTFDDPLIKSILLATVANNFDKLNNPANSEFYFKEAISYYKKSNHKDNLYKYYGNITDHFNVTGNYKLALIYADSIILSSNTSEAQSLYYLYKADAFRGLKQWDKSLASINKCIEIDKSLEDNYCIATDINKRADIYFEKRDFMNAFRDYSEALNLFKVEEDLVQEKQMLRGYVNSFLHIHHPEVALIFEKYLTVNDSLMAETLDKNSIELEAKYQATQKELKINEQQLTIQKNTNRRNLIIGGAISILFSLLFIIILIKRKQKSQQLIFNNNVLAMQQQVNLMELQNLNQQLDPHELKNFLANIAPEIQQQAPEAYSHLIKLFSIVKSALNNKSFTESLILQIQQAEDYLAIEKKILNVPLNYEIKNQVAQDFQLPRLLLKNLVENAVKHGIKPKMEGGEIFIYITRQNNEYLIHVSDNGTGINSPSIADSSGMGIETYKKIFDLLNTRNRSFASINKQSDEKGTVVEIVIPEGYKFE